MPKVGGSNPFGGTQENPLGEVIYLSERISPRSAAVLAVERLTAPVRDIFTGEVLEIASAAEVA